MRLETLSKGVLGGNVTGKMNTTFVGRSKSTEDSLPKDCPLGGGWFRNIQPIQPTINASVTREIVRFNGVTIHGTDVRDVEGTKVESTIVESNELSRGDPLLQKTRRPLPIVGRGKEVLKSNHQVPCQLGHCQ